MLKILLFTHSEIKVKYEKYTKYEAIRIIWNYIFNTPLLTFENCWIVEHNKILGFNLSEVNKISGCLSSSEKTLLAYWLQNFNNSIADKFFSFDEMLMQVSLNEDKYYFLVELFNKYPLFLQDSKY